tara:strand:- start:953 stop:1318 length:366 start_codon:yes stop_codon:yes gene_type:complete
MTAPNIVNTTTITAKTDVQAVGTSATAITTNSAASGQVYKINSILVANIDGTNAADITVDLFRGSTAYRLASTVSVPADSTLVVVSKDTAVYLEEGDAIRCTASAAGDLQALCSYEIINDA